MLFRTFCLVSLLTIALPNIITFEGLAGQTKQQVEEKPRADQTSSNRPEAGELTAESVETTERHSQADYPRIDVDLSRQMLSVIDESGKVTKVLPISTGSGRWYVSEGERRLAVTPTGRFRVYRKIPGWRKSPLGLMYYPVYIAGGVAIHGSPSIPVTPASHGCIRIPVYAAKAFSEMTPTGTVVIVHDGAAQAGGVGRRRC